jgi:membrane glycosyltransferase
MVLGALAYLTGPALLVFLTLGALVTVSGTGAVPPGVSAILIGATVGCLLLPRLLALVEVARDVDRRREHGGLWRLLLSICIELLVSVWTAPLLLLHHTHIVLSIMFGRAVKWTAQVRGARSRRLALVRFELPNTVFGFALLLCLQAWMPTLTLWLAPLWLPCALAIPWAIAISSPWPNRIARRLGLLVTASDTEPHPLIGRARELRAMTISHAAARFRDLVLDPVLLATHLRRLPASQSSHPEINQVYTRALRLGPAALSAAERALLESHAPTLRRLHREAWRRWPIESWDLARAHPQTPDAID